MFLRWKVRPHAQWRTKQIILILLPVVLLAADLLLHPRLIEDRDDASMPGSDLFTSGSSTLGVLKAHTIALSLDDVDDPDYLSFALSGGRFMDAVSPWWKRGNVLAIAIVPVNDGWTGNVLSHLLRKLSQASRADHDGVIDLLHTAKQKTANVLWYDMHNVDSRSPAFPIDHILLIKIQPDEGKERYQQTIHEMLQFVARERISNLIVPCLGGTISAISPRIPEGANTLTCSDSYQALFQTLDTGESPSTIYLSIYKRWTDGVITSQVRSLATLWNSALFEEEKKLGSLPILYKIDVRMMLFSLSICLFMCSRRVELTTKTFVILCLTFVPAALELQDKASPLILGLVPSWPGWVIRAILLTILSFGYVFFASLDYEGALRAHVEPNNHEKP